MIEDYLDKVTNIDCIEGMRQLPDGCIDLCVTSPPYNVGIEYDVYNDNLSWPEYYGWCREWLAEVYRVLADDGRFCLNHYLTGGNSSQRVAPLMTLQQISGEIGFKFHSTAIWTDITLCKLTAWGSWLSASSPYMSCPYEGILVLYKHQWKKKNVGASTITPSDFRKGCSGIWDMAPCSETTKANFPVELPLLCINLLSYRGDTVLDPFSGGGTTGLAALKQDRRFIGFELSPAYTKVANRELERYRNQRRIDEF